MSFPKTKTELIHTIIRGGVGILPTDTVYGIVANAKYREAVEHLYELKKRETNKPFVILISKISDLKKFGIKLSKTAQCLLPRIWPNKISVILPCQQKRFYYLHRGHKSLAFRMPNDKKLLELLHLTGPLATSSANLSGKPTAKNIDEAKSYFGRQVDFYVNGGELISEPSTLIEIKGKKILIKRQGGVKIETIVQNSKGKSQN